MFLPRVVAYRGCIYKYDNVYIEMTMYYSASTGVKSGKKKTYPDGGPAQTGSGWLGMSVSRFSKTLNPIYMDLATE